MQKMVLKMVLRYQVCNNQSKKNYLVSKPNSHTTKMLLDNLLAKRIKKTWILMNKPVYLGLSILEICKIE